MIPLPIIDHYEDHEAYRDSVATFTADGKRIWLYPQQPQGRWYDRRKVLSYGLLAVLIGLPFLSINGKPLFLFDVMGRQFRFFGIGFAPQDLFIAGLTMLTGIVAIALFTVVYGRLFCGWICPQTIFMELVYRRIEYFIDGTPAQQRRLTASSWTWEKVRKRVAKHILFFAIAVGIAQIFLSYMIGWREVYRIATEPIADHIYGFSALIGFSAMFYGVFARLREQVCISICPYGRLQSVLVNEESIGVAYDEVRGEPRGKIRRKASTSDKGLSPKPASPLVTNQPVAGTAQPAAVHTGAQIFPKDGGADLAQARAANAVPALIALLDAPGSVSSFAEAPETLTATEPRPIGDCIDCGLCVRVCPTGIDIRNGFNQLECVHCTACIDACDSIMDQVGRPRGLIRYASQRELAGGPPAGLTRRAKSYAVVLLLLVAANAALLFGRASVELTIVRTPGVMASMNADGSIANLYNYQFYNKTEKQLPVHLRLHDAPAGASIRLIGAAPNVEPNSQSRGSFFVDVPAGELTGKSNVEIRVELVDQDESVLDAITTSFITAGATGNKSSR